MNSPGEISKPNYDSFTSHMQKVLMGSVEPLEEDRFWKIIEEIDWPRHARDWRDERISQHLAKTYPLEVFAAAAASANDKSWDVRNWLRERGADEDLIHSEDGEEDFGYHIVGMGRNFYQGLSRDPEPGLKIAREELYVESLKYVFDATFPLYPYEDYQSWITSKGHPLPVTEIALARWKSLLDLGQGVFGVVARRDPGSVLVITPINDRTIPVP